MKKSSSNKTKKPVTNVDYCISYILQKIESGELADGARLGEPSLAKEIGVDRATVRTAFERLSASGILERKARSGTYLKGMSLDDIRAANQVRVQLESLSARLAAEKATDEELELLMKNAKIVDELTDQYMAGQVSLWSSIRSLEIEFHTMIARLSRNSYLLSMLSRSSFLQVCFPFFVLSKSMEPGSVRNYFQDTVASVDVVKAIQSRDPERAAEVITWHVEGSLYLYKKVTDDLESGALVSKQKVNSRAKKKKD